MRHPSLFRNWLFIRYKWTKLEFTIYIILYCLREMKTGGEWLWSAHRSSIGILILLFYCVSPVVTEITFLMAGAIEWTTTNIVDGTAGIVVARLPGTESSAQFQPIVPQSASAKIQEQLKTKRKKETHLTTKMITNLREAVLKKRVSIRLQRKGFAVCFHRQQWLFDEKKHLVRWCWLAFL